MAEMKNIILGSALFNWGETHRMVGIGEELEKRGYQIIYLGKGKYDYMIDETDFIRAEVPTDEEWFTQERIAKMMDMDTYVNNYATAEEIDRQISAEVEVMRKYNPVCVVTGYRTTLSLSARVLNVPLVWVMSSAISKEFFTKKIESLPENSILNRYFDKEKMNKNKDVMLGFVKQMLSMYDETSKEWNKVNKKYGLPKFESDLDIFKGELNIISDPFEFGEDEDGYKYCGPIFLHKKIEMPEITKDIDSINKKKVFVILGSSGQKDHFTKVLDAVADYDCEFYIAANKALSPEDKAKYPSNFHFSDVFPVFDMAQKVDACITNGGQGTIYAVLAAGKPFVGISLFMEQQYNLETLTSRGFGLQVPKEKITKESMKEALDKVLYDETYINKAKEGEAIVRKYYDDPDYYAEGKAADLIKEYLDEKES